MIALLVEEGDDISNLEIPKESAAEPAKPAEPKESKPKEDAPPTNPASSGAPKHTSHIHVDGAMFPSVIRLLSEAGIEDYKKIKGTGVRGMLTKGDVLAFMGKASSPTGTYKQGGSSTVPPGSAPAGAAPAQPKKEVKVCVPWIGVTLYKSPLQPVDGPGLRSMIMTGLAELSKAKTTPSKGSSAPFLQTRI